MRKKDDVLLRVCVVCRQRKKKDCLVRVVKQKSGRIFVDEVGKAEGRGAYICCEADCLKVLKRKRKLERSFKCRINDEVYCEIEKKIG